MRARGTVVRWDAGRGFGFIRTAASAADVFFHVRDLRLGPGQQPREGLQVAFDVIQVGAKGPRAVAVHLPGMAATQVPPMRRSTPRSAPRTHSAPASGGWLALVLMAAYGGALLWAVWTRALPGWILPAAVGLSLLAFFAYWQDKYAAGKGRWRTPESTLHLWSLAGGWPGAWVAQQVLRHKSSKREFLAVYWGTVVLHLGGLGTWLWVGRAVS